MKSVAIVGNANRPGFDKLIDEVARPAERSGLSVRIVKAGSEREIDEAFAALSQSRPDGLLLLSDPVYTSRREQIARLQRSLKIPTISSRDVVAAGGLMGYGASIEEAYFQAGKYASRILKGEKPADLPVTQPTKFELSINLRTAKEIGITVPPLLLARADEVIE